MDLIASLPRVLDDLGHLIEGVRPEQLTAPTPCRDFTVRDLCNHVVGGGHMFAGALRGGSAADIEGPMPELVGDDPAAAWRRAHADFVAALAEPGAMQRMIELPMGVVPAEVALAIAVFDLMVHSWDLSKATGQEFSPDEALVAAVDEFAHATLAPAMRDGQTFAEETRAPDGADALTRLVAFTGRPVN